MTARLPPPLRHWSCLSPLPAVLRRIPRSRKKRSWAVGSLRSSRAGRGWMASNSDGPAPSRSTISERLNLRRTYLS